MLIPRADRKAIHEYIFREGVMVCAKDYELPKHPDVDVKNLYVSPISRGARRNKR
jgi:small subunit ribosomal protein S10e